MKIWETPRVRIHLHPQKCIQTTSSFIDDGFNEQKENHQVRLKSIYNVGQKP